MLGLFKYQTKFLKPLITYDVKENVVKTVIVLLLAVVTLLAEAQAVELRLKSSVYRGQIPVLVGDLFYVSQSTNQAVDVTAISQTQVQWQQANGWYQTADLLATLKSLYTVVNTVANKGSDKGGDKVWLDLCQPLDMKALTTEMKGQWHHQFASQKDHIRLQSLHLFSANKTPCIGLNHSLVHSEWGHQPLPKTRLSSNHLLNDGSKLQLWWQSRLQIFVPVARQTVASKQSLQHQQVEYQWVAAGNSDIQLLIMPHQLNAYRSTKQITAGQIISRRNSEKTPLIDVGGKVRLVYQHQGIRIESDGKALKAGFAGEVINVLVDNAKGPVKATVLAPVKQAGVVYAVL